MFFSSSVHATASFRSCLSTYVTMASGVKGHKWVSITLNGHVPTLITWLVLLSTLCACWALADRPTAFSFSMGFIIYEEGVKYWVLTWSRNLLDVYCTEWGCHLLEGWHRISHLDTDCTGLLYTDHMFCRGCQAQPLLCHLGGEWMNAWMNIMLASFSQVILSSMRCLAPVL